MIKRVFFSVLGMVLCLGSASPALAEDSIKIGVLLPITGPSAAYGDMGLKGIQLAHKLQPEVLGRKVELIVTDNRSEKIESVNAATRLYAKQNVEAIIGPLSSSPTMAASDVAERMQRPMIAAWATNPAVTPGRKWLFRTCFADSFQGVVAAKFAYEKLRARSAAIMIDTSRDYSVGLSVNFRQAFTKLGGKIVSIVRYGAHDQEFSAQLGVIKAAKPEVIYLPGYMPQEPLILRQAREMGMEQPFLSGDAAQADEVVQIGGKAAEGLYLTTHFAEEGADSPTGKQYAKLYRDTYGKAPDALGALGFDGYNILLDAFKTAGSTDPEAVQKALDNLRGFDGVCGTISLINHDAVKPAVILQVKDGKYTYLETVKP